MTFREFENEIKDTLAKYIRDKKQVERYTELILGLFEEGAEVTSIIRRSIPGNFHEKKIDLPHLEEEIGDIFWYIAHVAMQLPNTTLEKIATENLQKNDIIYRKGESISLREYQQNVKETYRDEIPKLKSERARYFSLGMIREIGEISEIFGEHRINHTNLNINRVREKLGDTLWYLAAISENYELDLETIAIKNIEKTKSRYNKEGIAQLQEKCEEK